MGAPSGAAAAGPEPSSPGQGSPSGYRIKGTKRVSQRGSSESELQVLWDFERERSAKLADDLEKAYMKLSELKKERRATRRGGS